MYFGSVRFFKNLIFIAVCVLILVPTLLAVKYYRQSEFLSSQIAGAAAPDSAQELLFEPDAQGGDEQHSPVPAEAAAMSGTETAPALPLSADPPDYEALYPDFYAPQSYAAMERRENTIYLTFDDGPSDRTDEILDVLARKGVKATFFVTGKSDEKDLERMRRIVEEGHTIGMHSFSHEYSKVYSSVEGFLDEFYRNFLQIYQTTGVVPTAFRFPGGSINGYDGGFYQELLSEMIRRGFVPYDWNVSSEDAVSTHAAPADRLADNVIRGVSGKVRGFVLLHDSEAKTTTPSALEPIIDQLLAMGFEFSAITPSTMPVLYNYIH